MSKRGVRHFTEEEMLMHLLREEPSEMGQTIRAHVSKCAECSSVKENYRRLLEKVSQWEVPEVPEQTWSAKQEELLERFRLEFEGAGRNALLLKLLHQIQVIWNYALENPLPTLGYIAAAIAFASERTISIFGLESFLPDTTEVFELLKQVL